MTADSQRLRDLATLPVGRLLWRYALPSVVGMVVMQLYNVVDRVFIGHGVGPEAIAGLAITFPIMAISAALGVMVGAGGSTRVSIMLGAKDHEGAERVSGNAFTMLCIFVTAYVTAFAVWTDPIIVAFGGSPVSLPYAREYLLWVLPGMALTNFAFSFNNIMRASGYPRRAMMTMIIGAVANVVLDPVFIFALDMGIRGAAIATDIAMALSAAFVMAHFFRPASTVRLHRRYLGLNARIVMAIAAIGASPCAVNAASSFINAVLNRALLTHGGDTAVASATIFTTYTGFICMTALGVSIGMQPIVGYNYGAGLTHRLRRVFWLAVIVCSAMTVGGSVAGMAFPRAIATIFTHYPPLVEATAGSLRLVLVAFGIVGFQMASTTFFGALGMAGKSFVVSLCRQVLFMVPLVLVLPGLWGTDGVWLSFPISDVLATLVILPMILWQLRHLPARRDTDPLAV